MTEFKKENKEEILIKKGESVHLENKDDLKKHLYEKLKNNFVINEVTEINNSIIVEFGKENFPLFSIICKKELFELVIKETDNLKKLEEEMKKEQEKYKNHKPCLITYRINGDYRWSEVREKFKKGLIKNIDELDLFFASFAGGSISRDPKENYWEMRAYLITEQRYRELIEKERKLDKILEYSNKVN